MALIQTSGKIRSSGSGDINGTMPSNFTAGNTALASGCRFEGQPTSLTINGTTATLDSSSTGALSGVWIRRVSNLAGGSNAFTLDTPGGSDYNTFSVDERDDIDLSTPLDQTGSATGASTTNISISTAGATDTNDEVTYGAWNAETGSSNLNITVTGSATGSWIENDSNTYQGGSGAYRVETTTGTKTMTWTTGVSINWRGCVATYRIAAGGGPTEITPGIAAETDTALALAQTKLLATGQAAETDTALALAASKLVTPGVAAETDSALAPTLIEFFSPGVASETNIALSPGLSRLRSVGVAVETDSALALSLTKLLSPGRADEVDTALAPSFQGVIEIAVGLANESDSALAPTISIIYPSLSNPSRGGGGSGLTSRQEDREFYAEIFSLAEKEAVPPVRAAEKIVRKLPAPSPEAIAVIIQALDSEKDEVSATIARRIARVQSHLSRIAKERADEEEAVANLLFG